MADPDAVIYAQAALRGALLDLSGRAQWRLSGADRIRYLNGQVTNDIRRVRADTLLPACVTTAKGRLCGLIFVSAASDFLRIDADPGLRDSLGARLERYMIADDAVLEPGEDCLFHLFHFKEGAAPSPPAGIGIPGVEIRSATRFGRPGLDITGPGAGHDALLEALAAHHVLLTDSLAESLRIEAGIPRWGAELTEETLPPEAGLDHYAIDYHKGCYIGQEVISRIKSVGHVNRRLAGFTASAPLAPGMTLHSEAGQAAGQITSAAWSFGLETWAGLGYLKRGFGDATLQARTADGATLSVSVREFLPSKAS